MIPDPIRSPKYKDPSDIAYNASKSDKDITFFFFFSSWKFRPSEYLTEMK